MEKGAGFRALLKPEVRVDAVTLRRSAAHFERHRSGRTRSSHCQFQKVGRPPLTLVRFYNNLHCYWLSLQPPESVTSGSQLHTTPASFFVNSTNGLIGTIPIRCSTYPVTCGPRPRAETPAAAPESPMARTSDRPPPFRSVLPPHENAATKIGGKHRIAHRLRRLVVAQEERGECAPVCHRFDTVSCFNWYAPKCSRSSA